MSLILIAERINVASLLTNSHKKDKPYESIDQANSEEDTSQPQPTDFKERLIKADQVKFNLILIALFSFTVNRLIQTN